MLFMKPSVQSHKTNLRSRRFLAVSAAILAACLVFSGCATTKKSPPLVYEAPDPQETLCSLEIDMELTVKEFNGRHVNWSRGWLTDTFARSDVMVKIPAGWCEFVADYYNISTNGPNTVRTTLDDLVITQELRPGITYRLDTKKVRNKITLVITEVSG